jgi:F0F1-type ATP synthase assembly protein I
MKLAPFTSSDLLGSCVAGATWGVIALALISVGAWLVQVMRQRVVIAAALAPAAARSSERQRNDQQHDELLSIAMHY